MGASFDLTNPTRSSQSLDPRATEQVLRRAVEVSSRPSREVLLGADELCRIADQVGVPARAVAAALAEHRVEALAGQGVVDRLIGPRIVAQSRETTVTGDEAREQLLRWLQTGHGLRVRTGADGVLVASARQGLVGRMAVGMRRAQGLGGLGRVRGARGVAVEVEQEPALVCLAVDIGNKRAEAIAVGSIVAGAGAGAIGILALVAGPLTLAGLPLMALGGMLVGRSGHRSTVRVVGEELAFTLDSIARGTPPPTLTRRLGGRLRG